MTPDVGIDRPAVAEPARMPEPPRRDGGERLATSSPEAKRQTEAKRQPEAKLEPDASPVAPGERRAVGADPAASMPAGPAVTASGSPPAALPPATLRQIADAVTAGAPPPPDSAAIRAGATAAALAAAAQAEGPVRLLTLQLRPAELGQVLVRMRLQDGRLEMSLRAEREETAELLRRDGGLLTALVREAGYQPDLVTVQVGRIPGQDAPGQTAPGPNASPQDGQSPPAFAGGQQQGGASPDQPARRTPDAPEEGGRRSMEQRDEAHPGDRDGGSLYL